MRNLSLLFLLLALSACSYTQKIRDGQTAFDRKQYSVATGLLDKEYQKAKTRVEKGKIAFLMGESLKALHKTEASIDWYQRAYDNAYGTDALRELAYALKRVEKYAEAKDAFKNLGIEIGSPYEYRREINACDVAIGWKKIKTPEFTVEGQAFNSAQADYSPTLFKDRQLIITSDRKGSTGEDTYNWTGNAFSDLYLVNLEDNSIKAFDTRLNTADNEGTITFSKDFQEAYFTRCYGPKKEDAYCRIMVSELVGNAWSAPKPLEFFENKVNFGQPSLSADGKYLYFSCNHPEGWGGFDIYVSERGPDGWGTPKALSRTVNTLGNEQFPFIDGDTLYFASDFHPGMGGLDIFRTYKMANGEWAPAFNLKPPINSGADDFGLIVDHEAPKPADVINTGYFTSTRADGNGNDDIYRFEQRNPPPAPPVTAETKPVVYKMILEGYVLEKVFADPNNPNSKVLGRKPLPGSQVDIRFGNRTKNMTVGEDGLFRLELEENMDYNFLASRQNYLNNAATFTTKGIGKDPANPEQVFEMEIVLDKIFLDKEIVLENIYYDFDKWDIREDAQPTLNALAENLKLNPGIRIQLSSHTDCRGNDVYNQDLSQKRAQSAVDYLVSKGIDATRLIARGYGESSPAVNCVCAQCTEAEHQANRRTTFKILE